MTLEQFKSEYILISDVLAEYFDAEDIEEAKDLLVRLSKTGELKLYGHYVREEDLPVMGRDEFTTIAIQSIASANWNWDDSILRFDHIDGEDWTPQDNSRFVDVSFERSKIAKRQASDDAIKVPKAKPGRRRIYNWDEIEVLAIYLADSGDHFTSANAFYDRLAEFYVEEYVRIHSEEPRRVPDISTMKSESRIRVIANRFSI